MLDLKRNGDLTQEEHIGVASEMQAILLGEIARLSRWGKEDAVFHGGTSIRFRWDSPRFSEDLDFMVAEKEFGGLERMGEAVVERVRKTAAVLWSGCEITGKAKTRESEDGLDALHRWDVRWTHPSRRGKVIVKLEFYRTTNALLREYQSHPHAGFKPVGRARVTGALAVPDIIGLWGDKIKAVATRPAFKWRDAHDLGFLHDAIERSIALESVHGVPAGERSVHSLMRSALDVSSRIYGKTPEELVPLLETRLASGELDDYATFGEDMRRWFSSDIFNSYEALGYLDRLLDNARLELERGLELCRELVPEFAA